MASLQEELEALLRLERQQQQLLNKQNEIPGTPGRKQPNLNWGGIGQGRQVSPLVTNLGSSGMKKVQSRGGGVTPTPSGHLNQVTPTPMSSTGVVDIHVPKNQDVGFFGVGSSLSFSPKRQPQDSLALGSQSPSSPKVFFALVHTLTQYFQQVQGRTNQLGAQQIRPPALLNSVPSMNSDQVKKDDTDLIPVPGHSEKPGYWGRSQHRLPNSDQGGNPTPPRSPRTDHILSSPPIHGSASDSSGTSNERS